jgi:hypothetical protein
MTRESQIAYERGDFWVLDDTPRAFRVMRNLATHAAEDSAYRGNADGLSLARARVDYLARRQALKL